MKRFLLTMAFVALFAGCQEEIQVPEQQSVQKALIDGVTVHGEVIGTRAVYTPSSVLQQLGQTGLPFFIKSAYGLHPSPYLSVYYKNEDIDAAKSTDDTGRQQWILKPQGSNF